MHDFVFIVAFISFFFVFFLATLAFVLVHFARLFPSSILNTFRYGCIYKLMICSRDSFAFFLLSHSPSISFTLCYTVCCCGVRVRVLVLVFRFCVLCSHCANIEMKKNCAIICFRFCFILSAFRNWSEFQLHCNWLPMRECLIRYTCASSAWNNEIYHTVKSNGSNIDWTREYPP